jgi:hypothetical protein
MKSSKATHGQLRRENRQLLLRAVYTGLASSRAELALETGLAKPTVSDLIGELINEGFLMEKGLGQSTDEGGKRPRLLEFVPGARHIIGVSLTVDRVMGVLANLDGRVLVEHYKEIAGMQGQAVINSVKEVINGLLAQLDAPLLCIGIGVPGIVDTRLGLVRYAPHLGWQDVMLAEILSNQYRVPCYVTNSTELAAMAQFAFGASKSADSLVTILVNDNVGVGMVLDGAVYHSGAEIGQLRISPPEVGENGYLESFLGWLNVQVRAAALKREHRDNPLLGEEMSYLHIRHAVIRRR